MKRPDVGPEEQDEVEIVGRTAALLDMSLLSKHEVVIDNTETVEYYHDNIAGLV